VIPLANTGYLEYSGGTMTVRTLPSCTTRRDLSVSAVSEEFSRIWPAVTGTAVTVGRPLQLPEGAAAVHALSPGEAIALPLAHHPHSGRVGRAVFRLVIHAPEDDSRVILLVEEEDGSDETDARLATVASRLQAILASAVELDSSITDAGKIYERAFENLSAAIPHDTASIQILQGETLRIVACEGFPSNDAVRGMVFDLNDRFPNHHVVSGKRALVLEDIRVDFPHFLTSEGQYESGHIRSWLGVPLMAQREVIGMITLDRETVDPFDPDEVELAQALANHTAVALSNASMYESLQKSNDLQHMLLRELHHRVKNNLQLVSSLLSLRTTDFEGPAAMVIDELRTHIQALAATHDNIFQPGLSEDVALPAYIHDVVAAIESGYVHGGRDIAIIQEIPEGSHCSMDVAVPLGLITSELLLNAVKHAFPGGARGEVVVRIVEEPAGSMVVTVSDNGVGFPAGVGTDGVPSPAAGDSAAPRRGFGFTLLYTLAAQMDAILEKTTGETGTRWTLRVPPNRAV
jgi:two-component sensor histidine kinase